MKKDTLVKEGFFSRFLVMLVLIAALALLPGLLPTGEAYAADIVAGGTCGAEGDNLTWTLDDEGLLTISGIGAMDDYYYSIKSDYGVLTKVNVGHIAGNPDDFFARGVTIYGLNGIDAEAYFELSQKPNFGSIKNEDIGYCGDKFLGWLGNFDHKNKQIIIDNKSLGTIGETENVLIDPSASNIGMSNGDDTGFVPFDPREDAITMVTTAKGFLKNASVKAIDKMNDAIAAEITDYLKHPANGMKITESTIIYEVTAECEEPAEEGAEATWTFDSVRLGDPADYIDAEFSANQFSIFAWDDDEITVLYVVNPAFHGDIMMGVFDTDYSAPDGDFVKYVEDGTMVEVTDEEGYAKLTDHKLVYAIYQTKDGVADEVFCNGDALAVDDLEAGNFAVLVTCFGFEPDPNYHEDCYSIDDKDAKALIIEYTDGAERITDRSLVNAEFLSDSDIQKHCDEDTEFIDLTGDGYFDYDSFIVDAMHAEGSDYSYIFVFGENNYVLKVFRGYRDGCDANSGEGGNATEPGDGDGPEILNNMFPGTNAGRSLSLGETHRDMATSGDGEEQDAPWASLCSGIERINIEDGVTYIGASAFAYCENLNEVSIPASVTSIGDLVFDGCDTLADVYYRGTEDQWNMVNIGDGNEPLLDATIHFREIIDSGTCGENLTWELDSFGVLTISGMGDMANYETREAPWYSYRYEIKSVVIEDNVTNIGDYAFQSCTNIASVAIPDSVIGIGNYAFENDYSLTNVIIPDSVTSIGQYAFCFCESIASIIIPDSVTSIGASAFGQCYALSDLSIGNGVTDISENAFCYCYSIEGVVIPENVTSIGSFAFYECTSLSSVTIPDSVTSIDRYAFGYCSSLESVTINNDLFYCNRSASNIFSDCPNLTVYGYSGTWLEGWVEDSGINFSPLGAAPKWIDGEYAMPAIANRVIHITKEEDLAWLAQYVNAGHPLTSYKVVLEADIDLSGKLWTPIGTEGTGFSGSFDGQGHTISGLTVSIWPDNTHNYGGCLFGYTSDANIRNICLADAALTYGGSSNVYPIATTNVTNCGARGWACGRPYVYSDLAWLSFETPNGEYNYVSSDNMDGMAEVTEDYLKSAELRQWINSMPQSGLYDWVEDAEGDNDGFPRMATEVSVRTWEDVAEEVTPQNGVYDIYTPQQMGYIASLVNGGNTLSGKTIRLQADIDLSELYWIPMSTLSADFDGNGHTIIGLKVGNEDFPCQDYAGLIGTMSGNVTSLNIDGEISGLRRTIGDSRAAGMIAALVNGDITDCHGSGSVSSLGDVGGLIGRSSGSIYGCSFSGTVKGGSDDWGGNACGGIVGKASYRIINQCCFIGTITGASIGGISGENGIITCCSAVGTLLGNTVGGICGSYGTIENCFSVCNITGTYEAGGLIGYGGYADRTIRNCYAGGSIGGVENVGALFGSLGPDYTIENCYWNQDAKYTLDGLPDTPRACGSGDELEGVTALTAAQMKQQSSFVGFDFDTIWAIDSSTNDGMPYLRQEEEAAYTPGDINGDGKINNKDVTRLMRYIKYHDVDVEEAALDVNGDGAVNNKDVTRLMRYIKYGDVEIH